MRRYLVLLGVLAACCGLPAQAQDEDETRKSCTWENAAAATVEQITANFREWQGKCVRVKALHANGIYLTRNRLLADRMAVLEREGPRRRSVALNNRLGTRHARHRPRWEEVLGTVGSCQIANEHLESMQADDPDSIIMLSGLCHDTLDHYLVPVAYREAREPPAMRLRRAELRPEQVELHEVVSAHALYALRSETGERMFAALEREDFDAFLELEEPPLALDRAELGEKGLGDNQRERLARKRGEFAAAVTAFRASGIARNGRNVMLYERWLDSDDDAEAVVLPSMETNIGAFWCRLREGTEQRDLPVRGDDIDNDPSRPFFCVWTGGYTVFGRGIVPSASVPLFEYGFLEHAD